MELLAYADAVSDLVAALAFESENKECVAKLSAIARLGSQPAQGVTGVDRRTRIVAALTVASRRGWKPFAVKGNPAPPALNGHSLFIGPGGRVHLFGGRSVRDQVPKVYALDTSDWTWDVVATTGAPPTSRAWHSLSLIDDAASAVCVYGGVSSQGEDASVYVLSALAASSSSSSTNSHLCWSQPQIVTSASSSSVPSPRSGHAAVRIAQSATETETLVFGGRTKRGVSDELFILRHTRTGANSNDWTCSWEEVAKTEPWPAPRDGHSLSAVPSSHTTSASVVLFGGNGQQNDDKRDDTWVFDTATRQWRELTYASDCIVPPPRSYHSAHVIGACLFVVAGRMRDEEDANVYMLDLGTYVSVVYCPERVCHGLTHSHTHSLVVVPRQSRVSGSASRSPTPGRSRHARGTPVSSRPTTQLCSWVAGLSQDHAVTLQSSTSRRLQRFWLTTIQH